MKTSVKMILSLVLIAAVGYSVSEIPVYGKTKPEGKEKTRSQKISEIAYGKIIPMVKLASGKDEELDAKEMYSRCPSGYRYNLAEGEYKKTETSEDYNTAYGKIVYYVGCAKKNEICDFKIDLTTSTAWLKDKKAKDYVTVDQWVSSKKKSADVNG